MGRQLFLHHYLPAHLASTLVVGALVEFVFNADPAPEETGYQAIKSGKKAAPGQKRFITARERFAGTSMVPAWIACAVILALAAGSWYFFLPLTYGYPGLSVDQVLARKWLGYDLHFAK
jgi:dolichyl-phosphate-mannose-protein mannosyltransferase